MEDFDFAERCLGGDPEAITALHHRLKTVVTPFLSGSGAPPQDASEICDALLTDLVMPKGNRKPRLTRYIGLSALDTWLNSVALNEWMDLKRRQQFESRLMPVNVTPHHPEPDGDPEPAWAKDSARQDLPEAPLQSLMVEAIETAFQGCTPEDFVLLQLAHCDGLHGKELAVMFGCHPSQITRRMEAAHGVIAKSVIGHIRKTDPWLDLKWDDFIDLCRASTPRCFGLEDDAQP